MLRLTTDAPDKPLTLPIADTDIAREAAETRDLRHPLNLPKRGVTVIRVDTGVGTLNASVNTLHRSDRLVVTFTGARPPAKADAPNTRWPFFERRHWDVLFQAPILAISDPLSELDWNADSPRAGLYAGTFERDGVPAVLALIDKVCDELAVPRHRVVLYGACGGGTAALLVGARRAQGTGIIAVNPPLRPEKYRSTLVETACTAAGGDAAAWARMNHEQPWRANPLLALRDGFQAKHDVRVFVAQNIKDKTTINRHFPGLWRRFDLDPDGGVGPEGRVMAALYQAPEDATGHEPRDLSGPMVRMAYAFFDAPVVVTPRKRRAPAAKAGLGEDGDADLDADADADADSDADARADAVADDEADNDADFDAMADVAEASDDEAEAETGEADGDGFGDGADDAADERGDAGAAAPAPKKKRPVRGGMAFGNPEYRKKLKLKARKAEKAAQGAGNGGGAKKKKARG